MEKAIFHTSLGWVGVAVSEQGILRVVLPKKTKGAVVRELHGEATRSADVSPVLDTAVNLLGRYFAGEPVLFDLPLDLRYYTPFQRAVWRAAAEIPCGETRSYSWVAMRIKNPRAARAVGGALGANPVPVLIP